VGAGTGPVTAGKGSGATRGWLRGTVLGRAGLQHSSNKGNVTSTVRGEAKFQFLTVASTKMVVSWVIGLCCLVEVNSHFEGTYYLHHQENNGGSKGHWWRQQAPLTAQKTTIWHRRNLSFHINVILNMQDFCSRKTSNIIEA
jgi:hypothetical protein